MANREPDKRAEKSRRQMLFEADAVCVQCGTVNPEGSLLCRGCGNNLRDQHSKRMAQGPQGPSRRAEGSRAWLSKAVVLFGILVVIWVFLNVEKLSDLVIRWNMPSTSAASLFWSGDTSGKYEELLLQIRNKPITKEELDRALAEPPAQNVHDGRYAIFLGSPAAGGVQVGQGVIRKQGIMLVFVANLGRGTQLRGEALFEDVGKPVARQSAGLRVGDEYYVADGFALQRAPGIFECFGQSYYDPLSHTALIYRVPYPEEYTAAPQP